MKAELPKIETPNMSLMNPFRSTEASSGQSVFANPFKEAEDAEKNVLEKHVKLAPKLDDIREINGRKICWNYRKGRCRFGAKCVFAHDCELLQKKPPPMDPTEYLISSPNFEARPPNDDDRSTGRNNKRPGLSTESITAPAGGKVLKMNHHQEHHQGPGGHFRSNNKWKLFIVFTCLLFCLYCNSSLLQN